jgi:hypothetical protein
LLLKYPLLLMLMLQIHHGLLSFLRTHPSELRELCRRNSGYLLTKIGGKHPRVHTVDRGGRFLEDLTSIHLGYVSHLLRLAPVGKHLIGVDTMVHESSLNYLTGSHHRTMGHCVPPNATRVHKLASSVEHRWVGRLLGPIVGKLGGGRKRLLELGGLLLGWELGLEIELLLRLVGLRVLIGGQKGGVDGVGLCGIHGMSR